jgi:uncharacterized membrane protein YiaA
MKHYFYSLNNDQMGPYSLEELKTKKLKKNTLVWTEGMDEWRDAESFSELKDYIVSLPPPLPNLNSDKNLEKSNDISNIIESRSETPLIVIGFIILLIPFVLYISGFYNIKNEEEYSIKTILLVIFSLVIRVLSTIEVMGAANRQNRDKFMWGCLAFFLPSLTLIIIGFSKNKS